MTRFSSETLDLTRFPAPLAIRGIDCEGLLSERKERLTSLFAAAGIDFDVAMLETDPAIILQQSDAYRELLAYAAINDTYKSGLVAFATGADLDHLGLTASLNMPQGYRDLMLRRILAPATGSTAAVMESDDEYRRRLLLAPEAFSTAGTHGGYLFHALSSDGRVLNADVWSPAPGQVVVAVQSREGDGLAPAELVASVRAHLHRKDVKPLTDVVSVRSVVNVPYAIEYTGYALPGPDPVTLKALVEEGLMKVAASRRTPSRDMPRSALIAGGAVEPLDKFTLISPAADIAMGHGEVAVLTSLSGEVETYAG